MHWSRYRRKQSRSCLALMLISLLAVVQISGLHLHLPEDGHLHVHAAFAPGHDHAGHHHDAADEFDLSPLSLVVKLLYVFPLALIAFLLPLPLATSGRAIRRRADPRPGRSSRLRFNPPLRAPPLTS